MALQPSLQQVTREGLRLLVDAAARAEGLTVAFTDRRGGASAPPYDTLNLAARVGDDLHAVRANRERVAAALGFEADALALARQVHGADLVEVSPGTTGVIGDADALSIRAPGPVIGMLTADCAPVVISGSEALVVAHAGWRGLAAGVVDRAVEAAGADPVAWVGPSIHACCYEVGPEVIAAFRAARLPTDGDHSVDPARAAWAALLRAGVRAVAVADDCTSCDERYFSHRRDGVTGRQGAFATLRA